MRKYYSRRRQVEEKTNFKKSVTFIVLSLLIILGLFFFGVPLIAKLVGFITDLSKNDSPIKIADNTPPAPPRFNDLPDATSSEIVDISGITEEGAIVYIYLNDNENQIIANSYGEFNFSADLQKGENIIYALAQDESGNKSTESKRETILFDNEKPELEINSPSDGTNYYGNDQKEIEIIGTTEPDISLTVNDRFVSVDDEGNFKYKYNLSDGENSLNFKATDKAKNQTEKTITVKFTP